METTRREVIGMMGAVAAGALVGISARADDARRLGSSTNTLFWVATVTPCDKNRKFDAGAFRDILAWFKHNGADGIVVLGTTGEFPSFSVEERKKIAEVALKDKLGMNIIVGPGTSNFPETLDLSQACRGQWCGRFAGGAAVLLQAAADTGIDQLFLDAIRPSQHSDQSLSHSRYQRRTHQPRAFTCADALSEFGRYQGLERPCRRIR